MTKFAALSQQRQTASSALKEIESIVVAAFRGSFAAEILAITSRENWGEGGGGL